MEQYPLLQTKVRNESFLEECQQGSTNAPFMGFHWSFERATGLQMNPELIDEEPFQMNSLPIRHTQPFFNDAEVFGIRHDKARKNSTGSIEEAFVLPDFKSYIQKQLIQHVQIPKSVQEFAVLRKPVVKRTGRCTKVFHKSRMSVGTDNGSKIVIRRNSNQLKPGLAAFRNCREFNSKNSTENSIDDKLSVEQKSHALLSEHERMCHKISKVSKFWTGSSLMIPNVFRITSELEGCVGQVQEYQDLSRKEVLAQNGGFKATKESRETSKRSTCETAAGSKIDLN